MTVTMEPAPATAELSLIRLHAMRAGYLLMGVELAIVKWPRLAVADQLPLYEGVTLCLLTAMSLLAFLGLRSPGRLPAGAVVRDRFEGAVAGTDRPPQAVAGDLDRHVQRGRPLLPLVLIIMPVLHGGMLWRSYLRAPGDADDEAGWSRRRAAVEGLRRLAPRSAHKLKQSDLDREALTARRTSAAGRALSASRSGLAPWRVPLLTRPSPDTTAAPRVQARLSQLFDWGRAAVEREEVRPMATPGHTRPSTPW